MTAVSPALSIIIPAWGVADLVGETLRSVQAQGFADWEAIVVDDGDAGVAAAVAPFVAADDRIRFVPTPRGGVSRARNLAAAQARAPLLAMLDGDDLYEPGYLAAMTGALAADPALGLVTCDATFFGETAKAGRRFSEALPQHGPRTLDAVIARRFNIFIAAIVRRSVFDAAGGFDECLAAAEDLDLWIRIAETGAPIGLVPKPLVRYRRRPGSLSSSTLKLRLSAAAMYEKTARRLEGRPEAATAAAMARQMREEVGWIEGEDLVLAGRTREGLALLRRSDAARRSSRWRAMMRLLRILPVLARPLLSWRRAREAG